MTEVKIILPKEAIKALVEGHSYCIEIPDIELTLEICCSEEFGQEFRDRIQKALLHWLEAPPSVN